MADISPSKQEKKVSVPEQNYRDPDQLVHDSNLSWHEKMTALKNWEMDEKAALVADDESMTINKPANGDRNMLEKIHTAKQELQDMPHPLKDSDLTETRLLTDLILMNIDACVFFRNAAARAVSDKISTACTSLEKLHSLMIAELNVALKKQGLIVASEQDSPSLRQYSAFRDLCIAPPPVIDASTLEVIRKAGDVCQDAIEHLMKDAQISETSRFHLACAAHISQRRYACLSAIEKG
jgi:hypothetical protein